MIELINSLTPKERAILFQAITNFKDDADKMIADSFSGREPVSFRKPLQWLSNESQALKQKLFADCFPEDLEPLDFFLSEYKQAATTPLYGIAETPVTEIN